MSQPEQRFPLSRRSLLQASALGLGGLAAPSLLAGCTKHGGPTDGPSALKDVPAIQLGPEVAGPHFAAGYVGPRVTEKKPFADGSKTFTVVVPQDATTVGDWNKNKTTEWFEKRTGLKINFKAVLTTGADGSTDLTKINAMLSGGDLPDAFMGIPFSVAQLSLYGQQGLFQPLDSLIATYAPETRKAMTDYKDLKSLNAGTDGKLYIMPGVNDCYHCRSSPGRAWINKAYLDKVGMPVPTSTDELRHVLLEFKAKNPSGKEGFIPLASSQTDFLDAYFMQPFLYNPSLISSTRPGWLRLDNGKVAFVANTDEWREALKYLRQLHDDGLLTQQNFTTTSTELQTAGNKSLIGFARTYWWGSFFNPVTLDADAPWRDYVAVPPLKGPSGVQTALWDYYGYVTSGLQITSKCTNPELLVQWSDYQMDLESVMWEYDGVKNSNWFWAAQGDKGLDGKQALFRDVQWPAPAGSSWNQYATMYRSLDFRGGQKVDPKAPTYEAGLYAAGKTYEPFAEPQDQQLPPLIIGDQDAATVADTATSVQQAVTQGMAQFSLGQKDINSDGDWKAYADSFQAMNLQAYLDIYQKAYDTRPR
jgi:putative aldouronate transport system substrate-binding protein